MAEQSHRRVLSRKGTVIYLDGGGWFRVLPALENLFYADKMRTLTNEIKRERGLKIDDKLSDHLMPSEFWTVLYRAMMGTVIFEWGDFWDEDGSELVCWNEDGSIHEENGISILLFPGVAYDFNRAAKGINDRFKLDLEIAEGNSPEPSAGISDTEG